MAHLPNQITLKYDGEAHRDNKMDVIALSDGLRDLGQLLLAANTVLNGEDSPITIRVTAFKPGSFECILEVVQAAQHAKNILPVLGIGVAAGAGSVLEVVRKLRGRKIDLVERTKDIYTLKVDEESISVSEDVEKLVSNPTIRKTLHSLVYASTRRTGTELIQIAAGDQIVLSEDKEGAVNFKAPRVEHTETTTIEEYEALVKFKTAHSNKPRGWKIELEGNEIRVAIEDKLFLDRVTGENAPSIFGKVFRVLIQKNVTQSPNRAPRISYTIKNVFHN